MGRRVAETKKPGIVGNHTYDALKWVAQVVLPGLATLYLAVGTIWGLPNIEQVVGTITALDVFLGLLLGVSAEKYKKSDLRFDGDLIVDQSDPNKDLYSLELGIPIEDVQTKDEIALKINKTTL